MQLFTNEIIDDLLAQSLATASFEGGQWKDPGSGKGSRQGQYIDWLAFKDLNQSVVDDVERIRNSPLVPGGIPIYGFVYAVESGRLIEVPLRLQAGKVR